jgi:predicted Zn-dependent protease
MYHQLRAALGFLELGDPDAAWDELESLPAEERAHPVVLRVRVQIYRAKERWMEMAEVARHLTEIEPGEPAHWTDKAWAERRHLGIPIAESTLLLARLRFPQEAIIHYNLACYAAVQGKLDHAKESLSRALELDPSLKEIALRDEDLEGIW